MALTNEQTAKLERLQNFGTRYEAEIRLQDGQKFLFCYVNGKSYSKLINEARRRYDELVNKFQETRFLVCLPKDVTADDAKHIVITYSGRTQREAIVAGELPFFQN